MISSLQTFRLMAEGLGTLAALNGQDPPKRPYDWQVKQPITFQSTKSINSARAWRLGPDDKWMHSLKARSTWSSAAQNDHRMTSKYRESDKKAVGSYAFESLSRYFDVIRWSFCTALIQVERALNLTWCNDVTWQQHIRNHSIVETAVISVCVWGFEGLLFCLFMAEAHHGNISRSA